MQISSNCFLETKNQCMVFGKLRLFKDVFMFGHGHWSSCVVQSPVWHMLDHGSHPVLRNPANSCLAAGALSP